ncbi:hypothetical protein [uncultured Alteromonas sp.]|jgi:hypothetical protein|uniref:hypothetical protein n=1 Tax=uncultured Alteromonas sp. TaxID=179113 RepID=UPI0025FA78AA|nr:hypothetical protein [uncultured Alteromonas sp.]
MFGLRNLFGSSKPKTIRLDGLGTFSYFGDQVDSYWETESPVALLPKKFSFGAIEGDCSGPSSNALAAFKKLANAPEILASLIGPQFIENARNHITLKDGKDFHSKFFLKTLTCKSEDEFEFGYHSFEGDLFIESFYRSGVITQIHMDTGCCS